MGDGVEASITISAYGSMRRAGDDSPSRVAPQDFMIISCPSSLLGQDFFIVRDDIKIKYLEGNMEFYPDKKEIERLAQTGDYSVIPIACEILSDMHTPIEVVQILKGISKHVFLLESVERMESWGRFTFLGFDPVMNIACMDGQLKVDGNPTGCDDPSTYIRDVLAKYKSPRIKELPPFTGGLVGYFSYDFAGYAEPAMKVDVRDDEHFQDLDLMLFESVIAFDALKQKILLITNLHLDKDLSTGYKEAIDKLMAIKDVLTNRKVKPETPGKLLAQPTPLFDKASYCEMVKKAKDYIKEGDIFQVVLSNRLSAPMEGSLLGTYRMLRTINPSPYMFYFSGTDVEVAGASPETLVTLRDGVLHTFPLAGTRPRGKDQKEDWELEIELLNDEKELAEHNMLVDLGRNDIGKIAEFGSVNVEALHQIVRFSHVMHIGSTVSGVIKKEYDALDAIHAILPAGTLSGAPKIRASQIIGELENNKRGVYGGAIGYIDFTGNMDTCIAIRLAFKKNDTVFVRSGAGIVADSVPEKEYEECINKAGAVMKALEKAGEIED